MADIRVRKPDPVELGELRLGEPREVVEHRHEGVASVAGDMDVADLVEDRQGVGRKVALQEAAVTGLRFGEEYYRKLLETYTEKRAYFLDGLDRIGLKHNIPQGTYFVLVDISEFLELPQFKGWTDLQFCEWMAEHIGVAAVPGSSFFREPVNNLVRFHFARGKEVLDEALGRLEKLKELKAEG